MGEIDVVVIAGGAVAAVLIVGLRVRRWRRHEAGASIGEAEAASNGRPLANVTYLGGNREQQRSQ